jgi:FkbM family methyltransferase
LKGNQRFLIPRILNRLGILKKLNLSVRLRLNGAVLTIPIIRGMGYGNLWPTEPWMIDLLGALDLSRGSFIDVGVNIGQTLLKLKSVSPSMRYVGFEPNPICAFYAYELIAANKFEDAELFPVGISTVNAVLSLSLYGKGALDSSASIVQNFRPETVYRKLHVPVFEASEIPDTGNAMGDVAVLKIDVEGAELEVIQSFLDVIRASRPIILMEILPVYDRQHAARKDRQESLEQILRENRYRLLRIEKNGCGSLQGLVPIENIGIHSDLSKCDYVCAPAEKMDAVRRMPPPSGDSL